MQLDDAACFRAVVARDRRFEGRFFLGVVTTGVYCRPGCPARIPRRENVRFYPSAAAAELAGFRACARCRPGASPHTPAWRGTSATVTRALRLIADGGLDAARVDDLADRLGVGERHLRRLFLEHVGASPGAVARSRRLHFARALLEETRLSMAEVALAAGFASQRRFNEAVRASFGKPPSALRGARVRARDAGVDLSIRVRTPYDFDGVLSFLAPRAIPGVEVVENGSYLRAARLGETPCTMEVRFDAERALLLLHLENAPPAELFGAVERIGRLFDIDADALAIGRELAKDARLAPLVRARPGLRVPGAWDGFETAVRAVLGQQVTVVGATTLSGRLVAMFGEPLASPSGSLTHLFPEASKLVDAPLERIGLPKARAETLRTLARAVARGELHLDAGADVEATVAALVALRGIGPWTASYLAMRALKEPDAFPAGDLGLRKALGRDGEPVNARDAELAAEPFRPFRAYAAMHLWKSLERGDRT